MSYSYWPRESELFSANGDLPLSLLIGSALVCLTATLLLVWLSWDFSPPPTFKVPVPEQGQPGWLKTAEILDLPSLNIPGSTAIQCYCPANGALLARINPSTPEGIDRAIAKAQEAQPQWAKTTFKERRKVLRTLLKYILENQDNIVAAACVDSGKPRVDACFGELLVTAERLAWTIKHGEKALRPERRPSNLLMCYKRNEVRWEPLGVVAAVVSWNYPFHNMLGPIITSIFAGNACVVKVSEQTAWSSQYFLSIVRGALTACDHSPNLVQTVVCWPSVAPHLISHPSIAHITFIGSQPIAHHIAKAAAKALTPLCLELGGKDAAIVLDDVANWKQVASILMRGVFQSAGQNCIGTERVIALPKAYAKLREIVAPIIASLRVGSPLDDEENVDVGACISPAGFDKLEVLIKDAVTRGATLVCGGSRFVHPVHTSGHYFTPTLLVDVTPDMPIAQTELFAPVFVLMRASSVAEAVEIANNTPYALGASVFGSSSCDVEAVVAGLKVGMVAINDFGSYYMSSLPFGGVKGSGYGRFGGEEGLRSLCNVKSVCKDRFGGLVSTSIPARLDYKIEREREREVLGGRLAKGMGSKAKAWEMVKGVVELGYGLDLRQKVKGVVRLARYA